MKIALACVTPAARRLRGEAAFGLVEEYLRRASQYEPTRFEAYATEASLLAMADRRTGRGRVALLLLDSRGKLLTAKQFADHLEGLRDGGQQEVVAAIGPADGWSEAARKRADLLVSLGPMTLPHALSQVVLAEQIYRALTILAGHPYHCGH